MTVKEICDLFTKEGYLINYLAGGPIYILFPHTFHIYSSDGKYDRVSGIYDYAVAIHTKLVFDQDGNIKEYADFDFRFRKPSNRTMFSMPTCGMEHVTPYYIKAYCKRFAELIDQGDEYAEQQAIKNSTTELLKVVANGPRESRPVHKRKLRQVATALEQIHDTRFRRRT